MLVLARRKHERIIINGDTIIEVVELAANRCKLAIKAPRHVPVVRAELVDTKRHERELTEAMAVLQSVLPIGNGGAIGLMEIAAGVKELSDERNKYREILARWHSAADRGEFDGVNMELMVETDEALGVWDDWVAQAAGGGVCEQRPLETPARQRPRSILVYRIPEGANVGSCGYTPAKRQGLLPADDYVEHRQLGYRGDAAGDQICLVPLGYPASIFTSPHFWVREADVANYAVPFVPQDHELPEPGKCFLGLNFEPADFELIQQALLTAATKSMGGATEHDLVHICAFYNAAHTPEALVEALPAVPADVLDTSEQDEV